MHKNEYKISVIIPVYNTAQYLPECLDSIVPQMNSDIEVICVNDGSWDDSADILRKYSEKYENIRILTQQNQGLSCARNNGLKEAKGKYIYFLDSDDKIKEFALKELYEYAEKWNTDILLFDADVEYDIDDPKMCMQIRVNQYHRKREYGTSNKPIEFLRDLVESNDYFVSSCLQFLRKDFIEDNCINYVSGILHEDNLFSFECFLAAKCVGHIKKSYFIRRVRGESITTQVKTWRHFWGLFYTYIRMEQILGEKETLLNLDEFALLSRLCSGVLHTSRNIYRYDLSDTEKENIKKLSLINQWKVQRLVVEWNEIQEQGKWYPFPYQIVPQGSKVVLYGAGNIGKNYYTQIHKNKYIEIVKWVDKNYEELQKKGLPVQAVSFDACDYEYVLLAVANENVAKTIIESLLSMSVPKEKIIWQSQEYFVTQRDQMRVMNNRIDIYNQLSSSGAKKLFLFMTPEHGNLGDYAIALAERLFLKKYFSEYSLIEVTTPQWKQYKDEYIKIISSPDVICISGGGYLGNMWHSGQVMKEIIATFPDNQKVLFPNTLTYVNNDEIEMERDAAFFREQDNLLIMARDKASYDRLLKYHYQKDENIQYYPDMALSLNYSEDETRRNGICLCLRDDIEKSLNEADVDEIIKIIEKQNLYYEKVDIHLHKRVPRDLGEYEVQKKINEFKQYELVITDRLHGMIFAAISGTPCIAFDNVTHKVFGVYEWIQSLPYVRICREFGEFKKYLCELERAMSYKYAVCELERFFEQMAKSIRERID